MQRTSSELRISDWSSDVCSSDLLHIRALRERSIRGTKIDHAHFVVQFGLERNPHRCVRRLPRERHHIVNDTLKPLLNGDCKRPLLGEIQASDIPKLNRSAAHTSELLSLMRISYAVYCLKTKK